MSHTILSALVALLTLFTMSASYGQIAYEDNFGPLTLLPAGQVNGRNAHLGNDGFTDVSIVWSNANNRWQIHYDFDESGVPGRGDANIVSDVNTSPNPPDFEYGDWRTLPGQQGTTLTALSGPGTTSRPVPVEWVAFSATTDDGRGALAGRTATEQDNAYFDVERSGDGAAWISLAQIAGAGTTAAATAYDYTDLAPPAGVVYYRLVQVDFDGTATASPVASVTLASGPQPALAISPTVTSSSVVVTYDAPADTAPPALDFYDAGGRIVHRVTLSSTRQSVDVGHLAGGVYTVRREDGRGAAARLVVR